jgi:hypothetical protein
MLVGCHPKPQDRPLELLIASEITTIDPRFSTRSHDIKLTRLVHAGLVGLDPATLEPVPLLAKECPSSMTERSPSSSDPTYASTADSR